MVSAVFIASSAHGQAVAPAPAAVAQAQPDSAADQEGEIVVTARKQNETITDVPVAVTALSARALDQRGITGYQGLSDFVPGFKYQNQSINRNDRGYTHFTVRGMYPGTPTSERQAASAFIDGVPIGSASISGLTDVERVEVIKGPQSAYFGRATFSGAINFITRTPSFETEAHLDASYARFDNREIKASIEGGLIPDILAVRVSGRYYKTDGQYDNFGYDGSLGAQETRSGAIAFYFTPTPQLKIRTYTSYWQDRDGPPASGQFQPSDFNCTTPTGRPYYCGGISRVPGNRLTQQTGVGAAVINRLNGTTSPAGTTILPAGFIDALGLNRNAVLSHAIVDYTFDNGYTLGGNIAYFHDRFSFITDTGFRDGRGQANPNFGTPAGTAQGVLPYFSRTVSGQTDLTDYSGELRLASPTTDRFHWLIGSSYFRQRNNLSTLAFSNTGFAIASRPTDFDADTIGLFASASYAITPALSLSLEGRYQIDKIAQSTPQVNLYFKDTFKSFTPRAILRYEVSEDVSVYASYARGTRPGQFNVFLYQLAPATIAQVTAQIDVPRGVPPEKLGMGELGFKGYLFDRKLRFLSAFYYGNWTNKHITQTIAYTVPITQTVAVTTPGGEVKVYGFELEVNYRPDSHWTFDAALDYAETDIRKTICSDCNLLQGTTAATGNRLPQYPAWTGSLGVTYQQPIGDGIDGFVRGDYIYTGRQYVSESNIAWTDAANRFNLRFGAENGKYRGELFVENLLDNKVPSALAYNSDTYNGTPTITLSPPRPRSYGVKLSLKL